MEWYSLFSHTGSETEIVSRWAFQPLTLAITNNMDYEGSLPCLKMSTGQEINTWLKTSGNVQPGSLITLNGYMRILPKDVLNYLCSIGCKIYNIHPAPIWLYPELKGKDPQERLYEGIMQNKYRFLGVVIHEVDEGVDTGKPVFRMLKSIPAEFNKDTMYLYLKAMAVEAWENFFKGELWKDEQHS